MSFDYDYLIKLFKDSKNDVDREHYMNFMSHHKDIKSNIDRVISDGGKKLIHLVAEAGHDAIINTLIKKGVNVNALTENELVDTSRTGTVPEELLNYTVPNVNYTPLYFAAKKNKMSAVDILLSSGAKIADTIIALKNDKELEALNNLLNKVDEVRAKAVEEDSFYKLQAATAAEEAKQEAKQEAEAREEAAAEAEAAKAAEVQIKSTLNNQKLNVEKIIKQEEHDKESYERNLKTLQKERNELERGQKKTKSYGLETFGFAVASLTAVAFALTANIFFIIATSVAIIATITTSYYNPKVNEKEKYNIHKQEIEHNEQQTKKTEEKIKNSEKNITNLYDILNNTNHTEKLENNRNSQENQNTENYRSL
jgi:hypothetical protein